MTLTASPKQHFCVPKPLSCSQPLRQEQKTKHSNCRDTGYIPLRGLLRNIATYGFRNPAYLILWWPCSSPQLPTQRSFRENYFQNKKNKWIWNILSKRDCVHLVSMQRKPWFLSFWHWPSHNQKDSLTSLPQLPVKWLKCPGLLQSQQEIPVLASIPISIKHVLI